MRCLGLIPGSHPVHDDAEAGRRPLFHTGIGAGEMKKGYACDEDAGIYFEDGEVKRVASARAGATCNVVGRHDGRVIERVMEAAMIA